MKNKIFLRNVIESDLPYFFLYQLDEEAIKMTSFPPRDEKTFYEHWSKIMVNPNIFIRTILFNDQVAGSILSFEMEGEREVGYWLGKEFWGQGIASESLKQFLVQEKMRPLFAHIAKQNHASKRVLEKCGFIVLAETKWKFTPESEEVDEYLLKLL